MTVEELLQKLVDLAREGKGQAQVGVIERPQNEPLAQGVTYSSVGDIAWIHNNPSYTSMKQLD